jgi:hypothetical protein
MVSKVTHRQIEAVRARGIRFDSAVHYVGLAPGVANELFVTYRGTEALTFCLSPGLFAF